MVRERFIQPVESREAGVLILQCTKRTRMVHYSTTKRTRMVHYSTTKQQYNGIILL